MGIFDKAPKRDTPEQLKIKELSSENERLRKQSEPLPDFLKQGKIETKDQLVEKILEIRSNLESGVVDFSDKVPGELGNKLMLLVENAINNSAFSILRGDWDKCGVMIISLHSLAKGMQIYGGTKYHLFERALNTIEESFPFVNKSSEFLSGKTLSIQGKNKAYFQRIVSSLRNERVLIAGYYFDSDEKHLYGFE